MSMGLPPHSGSKANQVWIDMVHKIAFFPGLRAVLASPQSCPSLFDVSPSLHVAELWAHASLGGPGRLLSGLLFAPASEVKKIRKSENQNMEPQKWFRAGTTPVRITEMGSVENSFFEGHERSEFPWRDNFRHKSRKCFGSGISISDFPKLSVTALFWWAKDRRPLEPPNQCRVFLINTPRAQVLS